MKAHVRGIGGSGKTSLSRWISARSGAPAYELDWIVYSDAGERPEVEIVRHLEDVRRLDGWVTEGAYTEPWLKPLLDDADVIIWLDVPWQTCVLRMLKRHIRAELARNNRHRGCGPSPVLRCESSSQKATRHQARPVSRPTGIERSQTP